MRVVRSSVWPDIHDQSMVMRHRARLRAGALRCGPGRRACGMSSRDGDAGEDAVRVDAGDQAGGGGDGLVERREQGVAVPERSYGYLGVLRRPVERLAGRVEGERPGAALGGRALRDVREGLQREQLEAALGAEEVGDEVVGRPGEEFGGRRALDEVAAGAEDRDAVAEPYRLVDVVRDEDDGLVQLLLEPEQFVLELGADDRVDRAERLVHEQHRRVGGERPGDADALLLAAGELVRVAAAGLGGEADGFEEFGRAGPCLAAAVAEQQRHGGDVVEHRTVREEARLLDDVPDGAAEFRRVLRG